MMNGLMILADNGDGIGNLGLIIAILVLSAVGGIAEKIKQSQAEKQARRRKPGEAKKPRARRPSPPEAYRQKQPTAYPSPSDRRRERAGRPSAPPAVPPQPMPSRPVARRPSPSRPSPGRLDREPERPKAPAVEKKELVVKGPTLAEAQARQKAKETETAQLVKRRFAALDRRMGRRRRRGVGRFDQLQREELRRAFVLREVFSKPVAIRESPFPADG